MASNRAIRKSRIAFLAAAVLFAAAALLFAALLFFYQAASPSPSPNGNAMEGAASSGSEFPDVDWDYWKGINKDVIGWITVPGTDINHPICQAPSDSPDYYLSHDVYGNYNPLGALYLDAECRAEGLSSPNAVILGHSLELGSALSCFGHIQCYSDASFASEHQVVLIQTPERRMRYLVRFANIVKGWEPIKRTDFTGESDFRNWYNEWRESATMVLDKETEPRQVVTLVSCSYNYWAQNERTVVTTSMDASGGTSPTRAIEK